ncbi:hypothetical protein BUALT_Bualt07G0037600 [Buddleja alternifolia]|uniref:Uncharacterized protein n=1 Tax=Buddleja alternifolia TaxID=168488 RepID=A0AAV6X8V1_9LAMI|nr:hypothetical protein BUALT_Bualt07G0037600 [Buddleja alternifolia]
MQVTAGEQASILEAPFIVSTPFSIALETLQNQIKWYPSRVAENRESLAQDRCHGPCCDCGAFRAILGQLLLTGVSDEAGRIFGKIRGGLGEP